MRYTTRNPWQDALNKGETEYPIECEPDCASTFYEVRAVLAMLVFMLLQHLRLR